MRKLISLLIVSFVMGLVATAAPAADLDGTAWRMHEQGKTDTEDLIFVNGQFTSSGCIPYGFLTSAYSSSKTGDTVTWEATQINKDTEKMTWKGTAKGKEHKGTFIFTDKKGKSWPSEWTAKKLETK